MEWVNLIISLISGIIGGNLAGATLGHKSLGIIGNSSAGLFGGIVAGYILQALGIYTTNGEIVAILANLSMGALSGAILTVIIDYIISVTSKTPNS